MLFRSSASLPQRTAPAIHFSAYTTAFQSVFLPYSHHLFLPSKTPIGGLYYQYSLLHIFDLLKKGWFSLPFPTPKNTYRGLILSIHFFYLFDLSKKGVKRPPFPCHYSTATFPSQSHFSRIQNSAPLSLHGLRQRDNTNLSYKRSLCSSPALFFLSP